ncbi:DUF5819 family protein [Streptomyces sp. 900116325]|uniref:DUF5819 family protein n=2 Tax=unclassified Streptomyces TaxID=2593676 RepID=UPI0033B11BF6
MPTVQPPARIWFRTGTAMQPPDVRESGEELPDPAADGQGPGGEGAGAPAAHGGGLGGLAALKPVSVIIIVLSVVGVAVAAVVHSVMLFLTIAPLNTVSQKHAAGLTSYIYPEFAQDWKLFAPNPTSANTHVQARVKVLMPDGALKTTGWMDLTAMDEAWIVHNPLPSQAHQNQLRGAWSNYVSTLDDKGRPVGLFGTMMQEYLLRIAAQRFGPHFDGGTVQHVQLRSASTPIAAPSWSNQHVDTTTGYLVEPWWTVKAEDFK